MLFSRSAFQHACLACTRLATGFGVALVWLWCGFGVALGWPWGGLGVALVWPWGGFVLRSLWLVYAYNMALGWLWVALRLFLLSTFYFLLLPQNVALGGFARPPTPISAFYFCQNVALGWF